MREGEFKNSSGCAIACVVHKDGTRENGKRIKEAMMMMHDRSNGLGGGFVGYGIYPEHKDAYAFHIFYDHMSAKRETEAYLDACFHIQEADRIKTRKQPAISEAPLIYRYFARGKHCSEAMEEELVKSAMFHVNTSIQGAYVFSCGKNMGIFKGVGYPEDIADFFCLEEYQAYTWIAHGRYPTNTPGWWAGAHPFGLLDFALVHNGEISSYDTNRHYVEMLGYPCTLLTDTEVITYMLDFLMRKKGLTFEECAPILAASFWEEIDTMQQAERTYYTMLRRNLGAMLMTGPFSIILGYDHGVAALNDRLKLRSLMIAEHKNCVYMASEEAAIRRMSAEVETLFSLDGGTAYCVEVKEETK